MVGAAIAEQQHVGDALAPDQIVHFALEALDRAAIIMRLAGPEQMVPHAHADTGDAMAAPLKLIAQGPDEGRRRKLQEEVVRSAGPGPEGHVAVFHRIRHFASVVQDGSPDPRRRAKHE